MRHALGHNLIAGEAEFRLDRSDLSSDIADFLRPGTGSKELAALYTGPFLDGFHLPDAVEFGHWVDRERSTTTAMACAALEKLANLASIDGDYATAVELRRRRVAIDPLEAGSALALMEALAASGDRLSAVRHAHAYQALIRSEMGMDADPAITELADRLRRVTGSRPIVAVNMPVEREAPPVAPHQQLPARALEPDSHPSALLSQQPRHTLFQTRLRPAVYALAGLATIAIVVAGRTFLGKREPVPVMAVSQIQFLATDTSANAAIFTDMLATSLARLHGAQVLSNTRIQEILSAMRHKDSTAASPGLAAAKAGAGEVLEGTIRGSSGRLQLDLRRVDLRSGTIRRVYQVSGADPFELADAATAAIAADLGIPAPRTALATVTTHSLPAYRLYEEGLRILNEGDVTSANRLFAAALAEDSTFPMAAYYAWRTAQSAGLRQEAADYERLRRVAGRGTERERLFIQGTLAEGLVDVSALAIAETLATRYPNEPEAHLLLGSVRATTGDFAGAAKAARLVQSMEAKAAVDAPQCRMCDAFSLEISAMIFSDSLPQAEATARKWMRLHPRSLGARSRLADVLERENRFDDAEAVIEAGDSLIASPRSDDPRPNIYGIRAGRFSQVDDRLRAGLGGTPAQATSARWLLLISLRNQGRFGDALALARDPASLAVLPQQALGQALFEAGRFPSAVAYFDSLSKLEGTFRSEGMHARSQTWAMAHLANALFAVRDTARLAVITNNLARTGAKSLYARDRLLNHYSRGLLLTAKGDTSTAIDEFRKSISSPTEGFTRENYELGRLLFHIHRPAEAAAIVAPALRGSIDASNYYVTRTELHELLGQSYDALGRRDSAVAEYRQVSAAWAHADPEFKARGAAAGRRVTVLTSGQSGK